MKSYTDIEQSEQLIGILPLETADMCYWVNDTLSYKDFPLVLSWSECIGKERYLPCWSLAALLDILNIKAYSIDEDAIVTLSSYKTVEWDLSISNSGLVVVTKSDPIDACVEIILKLKENNLL